MNGWTLNEVARVAAQNPFVARLVLVSLELVVFAAVVAVLIRALRLSTPRLCALLWLVVLAKPILGLVIGAPIPVLKVDAAPSMAAVAEHQAAMSKILGESIKSDVAVKSGLKVIAPADSVPVISAGAANATALARETSAAHAWSIALSPVRALEYGWLAIVIGLTAYLLLDMRRLRSLVARADAPLPALQRAFDDVSRELGLGKAPALRISDALDSPALAGILKPVVLLPGWIAEQARPDQLAWLLRHELMHYKMRDPLGLAVRRIAEVLFFFHPAVWWAGRKWEESMELACDRALLNTNEDARSYAEQLYWVLEHRLNRQRILRAGLCATRTQIGKRIASLLSNPIRLSSRLNAAALSGLAIVALFGMTLGLQFNEAARAQSADSPLKKDIDELAQKANSGLRAMALAIEAYAIDNSAYPDTTQFLTTPVSYINEQGMIDPFTGRGGVTTSTLKLMITPDFQKLKVYSVGPDGLDDHGAIGYDPTNGTMSQGDIMRIWDNKDKYLIADPELRQQIGVVKSNMSLVRNAIEVYAQRHHELPVDLKQLVGDETHLVAVPEDLFAPGRPVSYRLGADKKTAVIYSVGPDGKDNGGAEITGRYPKGWIPKGDVVENVDLANYWRPDRKKDHMEAWQRLYNILFEQRKQTGRDNAMIYYLDAASEMGTIPSTGRYGTESDLMMDTLANGWTEKSKPLLTTLARFETSMAEVRKGVALDHAENYVGDHGPDTPVPNFLAAQVLGRMFCVEGRWLESQGKYDKALDDYLAALTIGRDFGAPKATLIGGLICVAIEKIALDQITRLAASGKLDRAELERAAARLKQAEAVGGQFVEALASEFGCAQWVFDKARKDPNAFRAEFDKYYANGKAPMTADDFIKNVDNIEADYKKLVGWETGLIHTPYWEREAKGYTASNFEAMLKRAHPFINHSWPNFREADVRYLTTNARMREAQIATALEMYRLENGAYPEKLGALAPAYFEAVPIDPFSGRPMMYSLAADKKTYSLWSVGPDMVNDKTTIKYDPTNGTVTGGDVVAIH